MGSRPTGAKPPRVSTSVLFLSRAEVVRCLDPRPLVEFLGEGFQEHSARGASAVSSSGRDYRLPSGTLACSGLGQLGAIPAYTLKLEGHSPSVTPPRGGLLPLYERDSGRLLAVLESSHISAVTFALSAALATDLIAAPKARRLAVIGAGTLAWLAVRFLTEMRELEEITLFDLVRRKSRRMAERLQRSGGPRIQVAEALTEAVAPAEIVLCATSSRSPFLYSEMIRPGAHITTLGSDERGKQELSSELLVASRLVGDDRALLREKGALHRVSGGASLVVTELGELLASEQSARRAPHETTVFAPVGLPFLDLIGAWATYRQACRLGVGTPWCPWGTSR